MTTRLDAYTQREVERQRAARKAQRKAIEDSLPDPDAPMGEPHGARPDPSLQEDLRESDPGAYPDRDLQEGMTEFGPDQPGTMPEPDPAEMAHPQPYRQTPVAIGGA
jgi:hypothetical protein